MYDRKGPSGLVALVSVTEYIPASVKYREQQTSSILERGWLQTTSYQQAISILHAMIQITLPLESAFLTRPVEGLHPLFSGP